MTYGIRLLWLSISIDIKTIIIRSWDWIIDRFLSHSSPFQQSYFSSIEQPSESIAEFGNLQFYLLAAMGAVWIFVFLAICFGVRWIGKVCLFMLIWWNEHFLGRRIPSCNRYHNDDSPVHLHRYVVWVRRLQEDLGVLSGVHQLGTAQGLQNGKNFRIVKSSIKLEVR